MSEMWLCILILSIVVIAWGVLLVKINSDLEKLKVYRTSLLDLIQDQRDRLETVQKAVYRFEVTDFLRLRDLENLHIYLDAKGKN